MGLGGWPLGERELDDLRVGLAGADDPVVRPDRSAPPLPLLDDLGVSFKNQPAHPGQGLSAPIAQLAILWSMSREAASPVACSLLLMFFLSFYRGVPLTDVRRVAAPARR